MATARDIINGALKDIGVLAAGETASASEASESLSVLNDMLDSWSNESLVINAKIREEFTLVPSDSSYTMGTGGQFNTTRPLRIENAAIKDGTTEFEIEVINKDQYAEITDKSLASDYPTKVYPNGTAPLETIQVWPVPSAAKTLVLHSWKPLTRFTNLNTTVDLPPGYARALRANLGIELCPQFSRSASPELIAIASESKANIKRMNSKPQFMKSDYPGQYGRFNILTGGYE